MGFLDGYLGSDISLGYQHSPEGGFEGKSEGDSWFKGLGHDLSSGWLSGVQGSLSSRNQEHSCPRSTHCDSWEVILNCNVFHWKNMDYSPCFAFVFPCNWAVAGMRWENNRYSPWAVKCPSYCKTQNSGLRSKEEKPRDPINQPSRCNTQEGLLSVAQTRWLWSPGRQSTPNSKLGKLFIGKKPYYQHITYGLQSDW